MVLVEINACCIDDIAKDVLRFTVEMNDHNVINIERDINGAGFAKGTATWEGQYFDIYLFEYDDKHAGIDWSDGDLMKIDILGRRLSVGETLKVTTSETQYIYRIQDITHFS